MRGQDLMATNTKKMSVKSGMTSSKGSEYSKN